MGKKVYAVKEGYDFATNRKIENKIVNTWAECLKYVKGVKGAVYKSFEDMDSAKGYLNDGSKLLKKGIDSYPMDCLHVYVDGSYNKDTEKYAYGLVAVRNNVVEYIESGASEDSSQKNIRQIAGELEASIRAVEYALKIGDKRVVIFHDYAGICHHATGFWERREESSIRYYNKMNELMRDGIEIIFVKVDSHTGDLYNELVDEKCKEKVNIKSDKVVEKWLLNNSLEVKSEDIREEILRLAPNSKENIKIVSNGTKKKKEKIKMLKFKNIIYKYKINKEETENFIVHLDDQEKINLITYLLDKFNS
ncbi:ribonuclease H1 domain-containing protein [Clostridium arbusti]|uniref:ribonuclease H1 domain-containing protein n=1 Tax=Clostridium arbusti TaxID=1137848 RepID=UPI0002887531|nr:ribonuclease H family protein [Clostridium arbusti]